MQVVAVSADSICMTHFLIEFLTLCVGLEEEILSLSPQPFLPPLQCDLLLQQAHVHVSKLRIDELSNFFDVVSYL